jgi:DUF4097 and DUF4098 domain-containing protein YvlB
VDGDAEITNSFGRTTISGVAGDLAVRGSNNDVEISDIGGDTDVEARFRDVRIERPRGEVRVSNQNGEVELRFPEAPGGNVAIDTEHGTVILELPPASSFRADLRARLGEIETDFALPVATEGRDRWVTGTTGQDGPTIRVRTSDGDIRLLGM